MLTIRIPVADPDVQLTAFGAGALLRLESSATEMGSYAEVAIQGLLSGLFEYYLVDPAGTPATWYRWRVSNAAEDDFGDYSDPLEAGGPYLSIDQFRALAPSTLDDPSLRILLDAAAQDIDGAAGPPGPVSVRLHARGPLLDLPRPALSITSVMEGTVELDPSAYELSHTGNVLRRLSGWRWHQPVVAFAPIDDTATRQRVQAELVKLDIAFNPGLASQTIGTWSETYTADAVGSHAQQRADILATLTDEVIGF